MRPALTVTALETRLTPARFPTIYTTEQVDLSADLFGTFWLVEYNNLDSDFVTTDPYTPAATSLIYVPPEAEVALTGAALGFTGSDDGKAYVLPATRDPNLVFLGVGAEFTTPTALKAYQPADPRVAGSQPWIKVTATAVRGPGFVSVYQPGPAGQPVQWITSANGLTAADAVYVLPGGRAQYAWAFTEPGVYEIDVVASGFLGDNQTNPTTSPVVTMYFSVDPPGVTNTVPGPVSSAGGAAVPFTGPNTISVAGPTTAPAPVRVRLSVGNGSLTLGAVGGTSSAVALDGRSATLTGPLDGVNASLATLVYTPDAGFSGADTLTVASDDQGELRPPAAGLRTDTDTVPIAVTAAPTGPTGPPPAPPDVPVIVAVGSAAGAAPRVAVADAVTGRTLADFAAYQAPFAGGVRVAVADLDGDGDPDIVTAPGPGGGPHVQVFPDFTGAPARAFFAYEPGFAGGVELALGDVTGDGTPDIVTGAGPGGGPRVRVFDGKSLAVVADFFAFEPGFRGGVSVAVGDVTGDGRADIVVGAGPGGGPAVAVYEPVINAVTLRFFAYAPTFTGGVDVAVGDVLGAAGGGVPQIITGAGPGGGPHVKLFDGRSGATLLGFYAAPPTLDEVNGVQVGLIDRDRDGATELLAATGSPRGTQRLRTAVLSRPFGGPVIDDLALTETPAGGTPVAAVR